MNTITKLFEGLIESRLTPFTELHNTFTSAQQALPSKALGRQTHDAIYALMAAIQQRKQVSDMPTYCCFIDFSTAYPSVHKERLALLLQKHAITGKILNLLQENSRRVRIRFLISLISEDDEVEILRGLAEGTRLSPTLFGIFAAELIRELQTEIPHLRFPDVTDTDELNRIGAFLYVDDLELIGRSPLQLQQIITVCQDWNERSRMLINTDKTKIMTFYETIEQRESRDSTDFYIKRRSKWTIDEVQEFTYLGLLLDPALSI
jgi:hypothetical protein